MKKAQPCGKKRVLVLTGGGTAGHVTPALALLPYLAAFDEIHYIGSEGGMERELVAAHPGVRFHAIPCVKLVRSLTAKNLLVPARLAKSVRRAKELLAEIEPGVIFSKGGYVGLPVCLAAGSVPVVLHESDLTPGLANRLAMRKCARFLTAFDTGSKDPRVTAVGAPLRRELFLGDSARARRECGFTGGKPVLLVTGGSLGARALNEAVEKNLGFLTRRFDVVHVAGRGNEAGPTLPGYFRLGFTDRMPDYMKLADYALTRGGANTLFELAALRVPALVVPLPKAASRGDQIDNARYFESRGLTLTLLQENLASLPEALERLVSRGNELRAALTAADIADASPTIARILTEFVE